MQRSRRGRLSLFAQVTSWQGFESWADRCMRPTPGADGKAGKAVEGILKEQKPVRKPRGDDHVKGRSPGAAGSDGSGPILANTLTEVCARRHTSLMLQP